MKCKKIKRTTKVKVKEKPVQEEKGKEEFLSIIKEDKFVFAADMMGKTEQDLKNDTYKSYIRTFMNNIGKSFKSNSASLAKIESAISTVKKFNGAGVVLSPICFDVIKRIKNKVESSNVSVLTLAGAPCGLSTIGGLKKDISVAIRRGANGIVAVLPTASIELSNLVAVKKEFVSLARKYKNYPFGIAINPDFPTERIKTFIEETKNSKITCITLLADELDVVELGNYVTKLANVKGDKKLAVTCSLDTFDEISYILKRGADKVYTAHFESLCEELIQKFGVQM
ncbi:MAG: hypothetical protein E7362_01920 [Clostridiales bacterium]|nr:hypothetical protein [Clostridiales bacterium]